MEGNSRDTKIPKLVKVIMRHEPIPGARPEDKVTRNCVRHELLRRGFVLLDVDYFVTTTSKSGCYLRFRTPGKADIGDVGDLHALVALDVNDLPQRMLHLHKINSVGHDGVYVFVGSGNFIDERVSVAILDPLHGFAKLLMGERLSCGRPAVIAASAMR